MYLRRCLHRRSFIENKKAGVVLQGHSGQKTTFTGTAIVGEFNSPLLRIVLNRSFAQ